MALFMITSKVYDHYKKQKLNKMNSSISVRELCFLLLVLLLIWGGEANTCQIQNCAKCNSEGNFCLACKDNYEQHIQNLCIISPIPNCNFLDENDRCLRCNPTFKSSEDQSQCVKNADFGCLFSDFLGNCMECGYATSMISGNSCSGVLNCQTFNLNNCPKCLTGYQLRNNICVDVSAGCASTNPKNGLCTSCRTGYIMVGYNCVQQGLKTEFCLLYNGNGQCTHCKGNLEIYNGRCLTFEQRQIIESGGSIQNANTNQNQIQSSVQSQDNSGFNNGDNGFNSFDSFGASVASDFSSFGSFGGFDSFGGFGNTDSSFGNTGNSGNTVTETSTSTNTNSFGGTTTTATTTTETTITSTTNTGVTTEQPIISGLSGFDDSFTGTGSNGFGDSFSSSGFGDSFSSGFDFNTGSATNTGFGTNTGFSSDSGFASNTGFETNTGSISDSVTASNTGENSVGQTNTGFSNNQNNGGGTGTSFSSNFGTNSFNNNFDSSFDNDFNTDNNVGGFSSGTTDTSVTTFSTNAGDGTGFTDNSFNSFNTGFGTTTDNGFSSDSFSSNGFSSNGFGDSFGTSFGGTGATQAVENKTIQFCQIYDNVTPNVCLKCNNKYYPSPQKHQCLPVSPLCNGYNIETGGCIGCLYDLVLQNGACIDKNCQKYTADQCIECAPGYILEITENVCKYLDPYCYQYNENKVCAECNQGYYMNSVNKCIILPNKCKKANIVTGFCEICEDNYEIIGEFCELKLVIENCQVINKIEQKCAICEDRYYLGAEKKSCKEVSVYCQNYNPTNGNCETCKSAGHKISSDGRCYDPNCLFPDGLNIGCLMCNTSYEYNQEQFLCIKLPEVKIENCEKKSENFPENCQKCLTGFYINNQYKCSKLPQRCEQAVPSGECLKCISGYQPSQNGCVETIKLPNCKVVDQNAKTCLECQNNFIKRNNQCVEKSKLCAEYSLSSGLCLICQSGYYLNTQSACIALSENCDKANQNGVCQICKAGYTLLGTQCFKSIEHCIDLASGNICAFCDNNYYVNSDGKCSQLPANCIRASPTGICAECAVGFFSNSSGACIKNFQNCQKMGINGFCQTCNSGFYINNEGKCSQLPAGCTQALPSGFCRTCSSDYSLSAQGLCQKSVANCQILGINGLCSKCLPNYYLNTQSKCIQLPPNCLSAQPTGNCQQCLQGFSLLGANCVESILNCETVISNGVCGKCLNGFYVNNSGKCSQLSSNCVKASGNGMCVQCVSPYILSNGACIQGSANCQNFSPIGFCQQCKENFYLDTNLECKALSPNCQAALPTGFCQSCKSGFEVNSSGLCVSAIVAIPNCLTVAPTGICSNCSPGWYIDVSGKCSQLPTNCLKAYQTGICSECSTGYYLSSAGVCAKNFANCQQMSVNGFCQTCSQGYYQNFEGQCSQLSTGCQMALPSGFCRTCAPSYTLTSQGTCTQEQPKIQNCLNSNAGVCLQCVGGYYINQASKCSALPANCLNALPSGVCSQCIQGFIVRNDRCIRLIVSCLNYNQNGSCSNCENTHYINLQGTCSALPSNCLQASADGTCSRCIVGFYRNLNGLCLQNTPNCNQMLPNGFCAFCNPGFKPNAQGLCAQEITIANCAQIAGGICMRCNAGYYSNSQGMCSVLPKFCAQANYNGVCQSCQSGYTLDNSLNCVSSVVITTNTTITTVTTQGSIQNCQTYNQNTCTRCIDRYFPIFNKLFCSKVPDSCQTYDPDSGVCLSCLPGFTKLQIGVCVALIISDQRDPNCVSFTGNICQKCSSKYYFSEEGKCIPSNPLCKTYNVFGQCTSCFEGYTYGKGFCIFSVTQVQAVQNDTNCKKYNSTLGACSECYPGFYYNSQKKSCQRANPLCRTSNQYGGCTSCYPSYTLNGTQCVNGYTDPYCKTFDSSQNCVECSSRYFKDVNNGNRCTPIPILCKGFSLVSGKCTQCYQGYALTNKVTSFENGKTVVAGDCEIGAPEVSADPNCRSFTTQEKNACRQCYSGYFVLNGKCTAVNPLCKTINPSNGFCTSCYPGYDIIEGECLVLSEIQSSNSQAFSDPYCVKTQNSVCIECSKGFFYNQTSMACTLLDPYCKTHNMTTGGCLTCYQGFQRSGDKCVVAGTFAPSAGSQQQTIYVDNCEEYQNNQCVRCYPRYFYNKNTNKCDPVSSTCQEYDLNTGKCKTCITGFFFQDNECVQVGYFDNNCVRYTNAYCSQCKGGYYLNTYFCQVVDSRCVNFNYTQNICQGCISGYTPNGAKCIPF